MTPDRKEPRVPDDRLAPATALDAALAEIKRVIVGQERLLRMVLEAVPAPRTELAREASA